MTRVLGLAALLVATFAGAGCGGLDLGGWNWLPISGPLHVQGDHLVDAQGGAVRLRGVNRSGSEYACAEGFGIFDGPTDQASISAIQAWGANVVRVPLNEACWLSLGGVDPRFSGEAYRDAISAYVGRLDDAGLLVILELHLAAPDGPTLDQVPMPDRAHSPELWTEVAYAFKQRPRVIFDPFNEPFPDGNQDSDAAWLCWRTGGFCPGLSYEAAGMQELVEAIRGAGASNLILMGGVQYANALKRWADFAPDDPLHNVAAAWHVYKGNACSDAGCFDDTLHRLAGRVPVVTTEVGQLDGEADFLEPALRWFDLHQGHYLAWAWDVWPLPVSLIDDYDGTPHGAYGRAFHDHLGAQGTQGR